MTGFFNNFQRVFSYPVSRENIEQVIQNSIPESTKRDTKYCISIWDERIVNNVLESEMKWLQTVGLETGQRIAEVISFEEDE